MLVELRLVEQRYQAVQEVRAATGRRATSGGSKRSGSGCGSGAPCPGNSLDGLDRDVKEMRGDGGIAGGEDGTGVVDALFDLVGVADGVLTNGTVNDFGLGGVDESSEVADALLRLLADLDGSLAHTWRISVPKYLNNLQIGVGARLDARREQP